MKYTDLINGILTNVGGKDNISFATFCMTRLRLNLKDKSVVKDDEIKKIEGVIGTKVVGAQYQIIVGTDVENIYKEFCEMTGLQANEGVDENLDKGLTEKKEKITFKSILNKIMDVLSGCVAPMLPIITAAGLLKMIVAVLGPNMLNVCAADSDLMVLFSFVGDAGFYFFPVFVAYASAKKFKANIPMALFLAGILLHPTISTLVTAGNPFTVYGIPMTLTTYSSTFIPMILITWVMSYVEKLLNKYIPTSLKALLYPLLLTLIMLPLALCVLGPLGTIIGQGIAQAVVALHSVLGPVSIALVAALWPLLIATGMHQALIAVAITYIAANGFDDSILVGAIVSNYPMIAIGTAYLIKAKTAEARSYGISSLVTLALGGISEPTIFGIILRYKKAIAYLIAGGLAGGMFAGIMKVAVYFVPSGNVLVALGFAGENANSLPMGVVAAIIAFVVAFVLAMIFGFEDKKGNKQDEAVIAAE